MELIGKASISHDKSIVEEMRRDPEFAVEYLRAALEDTDEPQVLLIVLRHVAEAKGGIAKIAKAAGVKRESLYRALSERGDRAAFDVDRRAESGGTQAHRRVGRAGTVGRVQGRKKSPGVT